VVYFYSEIKAPMVSKRYFGLKVVTEENVDGQQGTYYNSWSLDPEKKSNLYLSSGSWKLVPYGPGGKKTLTFYTVITDPGGSIPDFLKNKSTEVAIPGVYEAITKRAAEGLKSGAYKLPPPEDQVEKAILGMIAKTRNLDASTLDSLPPDEKKELKEGDFLVSMEDVKGTWLNMGQAVAIFNAPPDRVFRTVVDYGAYKDYIPYVVESEVDDQRSKGKNVYLRQRLDFGLILLKDRYYTIQLTQNENLDGKKGTYFIQWVLDPTREHNVIKNVGSWKLVPYGDEGARTLVFYTLMGDPGGLSPWFWKNLSVKKAVKKVLRAIEKRAEIGSGP
jgi:ribosome-associated toxin RatA of RatAB toxin-antitoxin module